MNLYIFERIESVSDNYHSEGGLVLIAKNEDHAREIINDKKYHKHQIKTWYDPRIVINEDDWQNCTVYELKEQNVEPGYYIMPDAGCC